MSPFLLYKTKNKQISQTHIPGKGLCRMLKNNDCWLFVKILSLFLLLSLLLTYKYTDDDLTLGKKNEMFVYFIFILHIQKVNLEREQEQKKICLKMKKK